MFSLVLFHLGGIKLDLRANIIEKRGTLQVVITYKDALGVSRQSGVIQSLRKKKIRNEQINQRVLPSHSPTLKTFKTNSSANVLSVYFRWWL